MAPEASRATGPAWVIWVRRVVLAVGILVLVAGVGWVVAIGLDHVGVKPVACHVQSAAPSRTGGGRSTGSSSVLVQTQDCGQVLVTGEIDHGDLDAAARSFVPGSEYQFDMGFTSRTFARYVNMIPTARTYHRLS